MRSSSKNAYSLRKYLISGASLSILAVAPMALAQTEDAVDDEVVTVGTRQVIQDSITMKRNSTQIVDGLAADEIGDIPALSIGEALENVTGVASHRENGGATEVSIRGLGPYLSSTVINGRVVGNGSGDRSVNFSQFPSELMNKLAVFKSQDASQIEGGVAGQIQIETLKPLDYGKPRFQFDLKGNINPDQDKQKDTLVGDLGHRATVSFVDQFDFNDGGSIGISVGGQISDISQPEAEVRSTSNFGSSSFACIVRPNPTDELGIGFTNNPIESNRDCEDYRAPNSQGGDNNNVGVVTSLDPTGDPRLDAIDFSAPYVLVPSQRHFRQNDTRDKRDALFAAIQWQPNNRWDINLDAQWSERTQSEERNDLTFNGWKRNDSSLGGIPGFTSNPSSVDLLEFRENGTITRAFTENTIEVQGGSYARVETFEGIGLNGSYQLNDRTTLSADLSYSNVERTEQAIEFRIQSDATPTIEYDVTSGIPLYTLYDDSFDVNDHDNYVDRLRVRIDNDLYRENEFMAGRFDVTYELNKGIFTDFQAGVRYAEQSYFDIPGGADSRDGSTGRLSFEIENDGEFTFNGVEIVDDDSTDADAAFFVDIIAQANQACRGEFPERDFLGSVRGDDNLITRVDSNGNIIGVTNSWGVFDAQCIAQTSIDALNPILGDINALGLLVGRSSGAQIPFSQLSTLFPELNPDTARTINVQEDTLALYAMSDYETTFQGLPLRGNVGVRIVNTEVTSKSFRQGYAITEDNGEFTIAAVGDAIPVSTTSDYTSVLPSVTGILELSDEKLIRFGAFRAISRADPADMGFSRTLATQNDVDGEPITDPNDLISNVTANGSPAIGPLTSWNFDLGYEWYPNEDSILAISGYYKSFEGGFENVIQNETLTVDGQALTVPVSGLQEVSDETSSLFGIEVTASHRFSYLPGDLSGLGFKLSYNYVNSDFEFVDSLYGDRFTRQLDGTLVQTHEGIIAPGGLPGLSENVFSGTLYYQLGNLDLAAIYKYRDNYFQPAVSNGTRLRYVGEVGVLEARAAYQLNDNYRISLEAINLLSEPKRQYQWNTDNLYELNDYGPRVFFGLRGRF